MRAVSLQRMLARCLVCLVLTERLARCEDAKEPANESAVLQLDVYSFNEAVKRHPRILVQFYAPWCGHSRSLLPEYEQAAKILAGSVAFARVDASMEVELANEFSVGGTPSMFYVYKGKVTEFAGRRTAAGIVEWVQEKVGPAVHHLKSKEELQSTLAKRGPSAAFVGTGSEALQTTLSRVAEKHRTLGTFYFLPGGHDLITIHKGVDEKASLALDSVGVDTTQLDEDIVLFLRENLLPIFGEISDENFADYEASGADGLLWVLFDSPNGTGEACKGHDCKNQAKLHAEVFKQVALIFKQVKVIFVDIGTYNEYVRDMLGVWKFPSILLQKGIGKPGTEALRYSLHLNETVSADQIVPWLEDVFSGKVSDDDDALPDGSFSHTDASESPSEGSKTEFAEL